MFQYLLRNPGKPIPVDAPPGAEIFFYHQKSGMRAILFALVMAGIVEMTALHYFLSLWNHWVAWTATLSTLWVVLTILAQMRAVGCRPILVTDDHLNVRNGMYDLAEIPRSAIERVEVTGRDPKKDSTQDKPLPGCIPVSHNVIVWLNKSLEATLLYGKKRDFQVALLFVDDPQRLASLLKTDDAALTG
ncbi:MAG: hypothetical protein ACR2NP_18365 [Pirellulaceae bacterium]